MLHYGDFNPFLEKSIDKIEEKVKNLDEAVAKYLAFFPPQDLVGKIEEVIIPYQDLELHPNYRVGREGKRVAFGIPTKIYFPKHFTNPPSEGYPLIVSIIRN